MFLKQSYTECHLVVYLIGFSCILNRIWFNNIDNQLAIKDAAAIDKF